MYYLCYVEKSIFHILKIVIDINEVDIDLAVVITNKYSSNENCLKYFVGYMNQSEDDIIANHINIPQLNWTFKKFWKSEMYDIPTWRKTYI